MTSVPPTQPPAAPETDVSALRGDERATLLRVLDWGVETRNMTYLVALKVLGIADRHAAALADLSAARERVRVVEGERETLAEQYAAEVEELEADVIAEEARANENATLVHRERARAESAEAAHRALQAAVEALADEWESPRPKVQRTPEDAAAVLRAVLAGGAS